MMRSILLFDLDGTLTDPEQGIVASVRHALRELGVQSPPASVLRTFIGPPLAESFRRVCGLDRSGVERAIDGYRSYFRCRGMFENRVYSGIAELLGTCVDAGYTLAVATSKPEVFAETIVEHFELRQYFAFVAGASLDSSRVQKADVIRHAISRVGPCTVTEMLMIGDRRHDVMGAREVGMDAIAVTWGYGTEEELRDCRPMHVTDSIESLRGYLLGERNPREGE